MRSFVKHPILIFLLIFAFPSIGFSQSVRLPTETNERTKLPTVLLQKALARGGKYQLIYPYGDIQQLPLSTRIQDVRNGTMDIFFAMTSQEFEQEFQAVYFPIYRGLMGMRLAIVTRENQHMFRNVKTRNDLVHYSAGQGKLWADAKILAANSVPLVLELKYPNLFRMLEAERFDYFPRGIHEPWAEIKNWQSLDLVVDPYIMLHYTAPFYFFVSKQNTALAEHLQQQLQAMLVDGSFIELFYHDEDVLNALANANLKQRTIINLDNPYLSDATPVSQKALWFDPDERSPALHKDKGAL